MIENIIIKGAREHNLKDVDITIPKNKLIVMTGLSGSGKSSLAFDTIYKEGQRRYVESLSAYARQFLGNMEKPDVDSIEGLSPAISIDQKTTTRNPRSTVGTVTEIYDYLRLLYARIGVPVCPTHQIPITSQTIEDMTNSVIKHDGSRVIIIAPLVNEKKGTHKNLIEQLKKEGYVRLLINGDIIDIDEVPSIDKNIRSTIGVVIDRLKIKEDVRSRLYDSLETASKKSHGRVEVLIDDEKHIFSEHFSCPHCDFSIGELEPRLFSFNAPYGACEHCHGLGVTRQISPNLIIPDKSLSISAGAIKGWTSNHDSYTFKMIKQTCKHFNIPMNKPISSLKQDQIDVLLFGSDEKVAFKYAKENVKYEHAREFEGVIPNLDRRYKATNSRYIRDLIEGFMVEQDCPICQGKKLNEQALSVLIGGKNIIDLTDLSIKELLVFFDQLELTKTQQLIGHMALKEVVERLTFLNNVGLNYLSLSRRAATLSGGESQRIRLATQIGSQLTGVLYVLDEPSIGLHQRDNHKLIKTLEGMRDIGNTVIVVEHDEDTMLAADQIIDIGPKAGVYGGEIVFQGPVSEIINETNSITGKYLSKALKIDVPKSRRPHARGYIEIKKASQNNLKSIDVKIPKGVFNVITGVSGSGKSSLVNDVLFSNLHNQIYRKDIPSGSCKSVSAGDDIEKIINIDQSPIGRTPRSNPATYTSVFDDIRDLFAMTNESKVRGYKKGRFSFNVKGGRCETCQGDGLIKIEMHFLPDVFVPCEACQGKRYNTETLEVKYKGMNISEVLDMTISDAYEFFENVPKISRKLRVMNEVGLGYIKLGQSATTLSGGEAQRVKLAKELHKRITSHTLYILDEPTTGLHVDDVKRLLEVINKIVDNGATVIVIEHNLDVIKVADHIIDLGPEGGDLGGYIVCSGTPEEVAKHKASYTGHYLKQALE
jgi:excinuclease ABC subunit A